MKTAPTISAVLVIADMADGIDAITGGFESNGIRAVFVQGSKAGLSHACGMQPDLILLDAEMADQDGFEVCRQLKEREQTRAIPVIFMLASHGTCRRAEVFAAGGADYVMKPLLHHEVMSRVGLHLRLRALERNASANARNSGKPAESINEAQAAPGDKFAEVEQRLREMLDNISDFLYLLEIAPEGRFRFAEVNLGVERLLQMPRASVIGKYVEEVIPDAHKQGVIDRLRRCADSGKVIDEEIELSLSSGHHYFQSTYFPIHDPATGNVFRIVCLARDITIRKQHEVMRSQRDHLASLLRNIVEVAPGVLFMYRLDANGKRSMPYTSPTLEEITGLDREKMRQDASSDLQRVHPEDIARHTASIELSAQTLTPWHSEFRMLHPGKGEVWIEGRGIPQRMEDGATVWYGFLHDVTVRKRAEELLLASEQKFRTLAENVPDLIVRYDRECRRIYANKTFRRTVGQTLDNLIGALPGQNWRGTIPLEEYMALLRKVIATGVRIERLMSWTFEDGKVVHTIFHIVPERDVNREIVGALTIGCDITELKETEMRLAESRERLRELAAHQDTAREEERKHIARELHDELGQFLSALRMQASVLRIRFCKDNPALLEQVNTMIDMVDRNIQMVRNIASSLRPEVLDLGIVAALEWLVSDFVNYARIRCKLTVAKENFDMGNHCATTLFRIVQESLTNVARHADARKVTISLSRTRTHLHLRLRDDGKGFHPDRISKKSFGLIGMRERVLMLGGEIHIISAPGKGTAIEVDIPADDLSIHP